MFGIKVVQFNENYTLFVHRAYYYNVNILKLELRFI